ncbi:MAG: hypothetical protein U1C46_03650 [Bacteroidales bacterium]|nr:hypothetical protein [Bacteroidales bacterium]MDZ4203895.1 hypothetical protein [Bacteroidales bacterium]
MKKQLHFLLLSALILAAIATYSQVKQKTTLEPRTLKTEKVKRIKPEKPGFDRQELKGLGQLTNNNLCDPAEMCTFKVLLLDEYGDGW